MRPCVPRAVRAIPKDKRLWMTFPIDFWMHPKIAPLTDSAFRAFVEMNGYSRQHRLDGRIPHAVAMRLWGDLVLNELCGTHPDRPVLVAETDVFILRDYAEHQETAAEEDARKSRNRENGAKGGRPQRTDSVTHSLTESVSKTKPSGVPNRNRHLTDSKAESESESESEDYSKTSKSQSSSNRARERTDPFNPSVTTVTLASQAGIDLEAVADLAWENCGRGISPDVALQVGKNLLGKAKTYPNKVMPYIARCFTDSATEIQKFIDTET
jgi:hypothetical protein